MTFEEFKEVIEQGGEYYIELVEEGIFQDMIYVSDSRGNTMCKFWRDFELAVDTIYMDNYDFLEEHGRTIFEFASTPIDDRHPVKKYHAKLDLPRFFWSRDQYLNLLQGVSDINYYELGDNVEERYKHMFRQTQFTMEEIKEIIPKEDMEKFKIIPVEEEE